MKIITSKEAQFLRESKQRLAKTGIVIKETKTKKFTPQQLLLIKEVVEFIEEHKDEMKRRGLPIHEELQLEFLAGLAKAAGSAAKAAGSAAMKGAKAAGEKGADLAGKALKKGAEKAGELAGDVVKGFEQSIAKDPKMQKNVQSAANSMQQAATNSQKSLKDVENIVKQLPAKQQSKAKTAAKSGTDQLKKAVQNLYSKLKTDTGDPALAQMMLSSAVMKLILDMQQSTGAKK